MEEERREFMYVYKNYRESYQITLNYCATTHDTSHRLAKTPESISMIRRKEPVCVVVWTTAWERFG